MRHALRGRRFRRTYANGRRSQAYAHAMDRLVAGDLTPAMKLLAMHARPSRQLPEHLADLAGQISDQLTAACMTDPRTRRVIAHADRTDPIAVQAAVSQRLTALIVHVACCGYRGLPDMLVEEVCRQTVLTTSAGNLTGDDAMGALSAVWDETSCVSSR